MLVNNGNDRGKEEAQREDGDRLRVVLDGLGPRMFVGLMDTRGVVLLANRPAMEAAGLRPEDVIGKPFPETYWFAYSGEVRRRMDEAIKRAAQGEAVRYDERVRVAEDRHIWIDFSLQPLRDGSGKVAFLVPSASNITEYKLAEEELRMRNEELKGLITTIEHQRKSLRLMGVRLAEAEEAERRRLARELHDQVGQNLTTIGINLSIIQSHISKGPEELINDRIEDSLALVGKTAESIRSMMAELRPPVLDDYGLISALKWYAAQFSARTGITPVIRRKEPGLRLAATVETSLFRIVQEALTNVAKHARASEVSITIEASDDRTCLTVSDNGVGFIPSDLDREGWESWGLLNMEERAKAIGAKFRIESGPRLGTHVIVEIPG